MTDDAIIEILHDVHVFVGCADEVGGRRKSGSVAKCIIYFGEEHFYFILVGELGLASGMRILWEEIHLETINAS